MVRIELIIAPTDFSPAADRATRRAASLASALGSSLRLVHVLPPQRMLEQLFPAPLQSEAEAFRARARQALAERAQRLAAQFGVTPECQLFNGRAHEAILDAIETIDANLAVLGAHGEHEGASPPHTVGDTALKIAERSRGATLLVRREAQEHYCRIVGCAKGVPADRSVIDWARTLSPEDLIHLVSAYVVPYEGRLAEWGASQSTIDVYATRERDERTRKLGELLGELGLPAAIARLHIERGEPLRTILSTVAQLQADLIVVGRRDQVDPLSAGRFGSVAGHIAFEAPIDVMIVPPVGNPPTG
jgi:nucleotide-binding universal stress UspA family protein